MVSAALDAIVNYINITDTFSFETVGEALKGRRRQTMFQMYLGTDYASGAYGKVCGLDEVKASIR